MRYNSLKGNKAPGRMEPPKVEVYTIKAEPGIKEEEKEGGISFQEIEIEVPGIKMECSDPLEGYQQTEGAEGGIQIIKDEKDESVAESSSSQDKEWEVELQCEDGMLQNTQRIKTAEKCKTKNLKMKAYKCELRRTLNDKLRKEAKQAAEEIKRKKKESAKQTARRILEDVLQVDLSVAEPSSSKLDTKCDAELQPEPEMLEKKRKIAEYQRERRANMTAEERDLERLKWTAYKCERRRYMSAIHEQQRKDAKRKANEKRKLNRQKIKESILLILKQGDVNKKS